MTTATKFSRYILTERGGSQAAPDGTVKPVVLEGAPDWCGIQHRMKWQFLLKPGVVMDKRHSHEFDEFLVFLSLNPADEEDFPAVLELQMGPEGEVHVIDAPGVVCIPKGLVHGPLTIKSIARPVLFSHIGLSPDYRQVPA